MRRLLIAAVLAAQLGSFVAPARGADLAAEPARSEPRMGAFAGARLRVALGNARDRDLRAGIVVAPSLHSAENGVARLRIGEGLEYGIADRRPAAVFVAGHRIGDAGRAPDGRRQNVSTLGWVAIGVGVVALVGVGVMGWLIHEANENTE